MTNKIDQQVLQDKAWEILMSLLQETEDITNDPDENLDVAIQLSYVITTKFLSFDVKKLEGVKDNEIQKKTS